MLSSSDRRKKIQSAFIEVGVGALTISIVYIGIGLYAGRRFRKWRQQRQG